MKLESQLHELIEKSIKDFQSHHEGCSTARQCANKNLSAFLDVFAKNVWQASEQDSRRLCASWLSRRVRERTGSDKYDDEGALLRADLEKLRPDGQK